MGAMLLFGQFLNFNPLNQFNMTKFSRIILTTLLIGATVTFNGCKKETPQPEVEQEEFNRVTLTFTKLDQAGNETTEKVVAEFGDLEHDHNASGQHADTEHNHVHVDLAEGAKYRLQIGLYIDDRLINSEITDEGEAHQFFFLPSVAGIINYQYEDTDKNNQPIGLKGLIEVKAPGELDLKVILRHNLNKSHSAAAVWNSINHADAGGADDLNIGLAIHAGH
jgi:hypothetical protein